MYCRNDYVSHFQNINLEEISHKQMVELFCICIKNDALKIGFNIYLRFMDSSDITRKIMDIFINSLKRSLEFHEVKLFFIHQHFDLLSILQMNDLVDLFNHQLLSYDYSKNPVLSQFNTIKYSLLIYRITWKIEEKKIYSLITKCFVLNKFLTDSLDKYLKKQHHIA
mmetsp:Transcript_20868/g.32209  ORF Transcript_20868/g.32209 Transcript_20868/m.32209 type:complete len:167 (+) Transcript_20868:1327-1827(+)